MNYLKGLIRDFKDFLCKNVGHVIALISMVITLFFSITTLLDPYHDFQREVELLIIIEDPETVGNNFKDVAVLKYIDLKRAQDTVDSENQYVVRLNDLNLSHSSELFRVDFSNINFERSDMSNSNFNSSNFDGANLKRVNFTNTSLYKVDFGTAKLYYANFTNAKLRSADLSESRGLETCVLIGIEYDDNTIFPLNFDKAIIKNPRYKK